MSDDIEQYAGNKVLIRFDKKKCVHSRNCVLARPDVFRPNVEGPWIEPDNATVDEIAELAHACPSGAIQYERKDGAPNEKAPLVNVIRIRENGPLAFDGELKISGQPAGHRATLCRCGASKNKPYCDGSHSAANFEATGEPKTQTSTEPKVRNGPLNISLSKNGPLLISGNVEVCSGTGRTITRGEKAALCRCGASNNKPFCDGMHSKIGFVAD